MPAQATFVKHDNMIRAFAANMDNTCLMPIA